jgi:putative DNA primase/helicase
VLRGAFGNAPLFFFVAPESGTGKSYLVTLISVIATGRPPPAVAGSDNKEEMEKRLGAIVLEAPPILFLNNLSFNLESDLLSQMITDDTVKIRILGKSEMPDCDCRGMTVFANGNNIRLVGDLVRRAVTARLDAKQERPETRAFKHDPIKMVLDDRGKYLAAIFTIARAYMAAGQSLPSKAIPLAGFDEWSRMVRYPLMWLGSEDPARSMEGARALDPQRTTLRELIASLAKHMGVGKEFTAADVCQKAQEEFEYGHGRGYRNQDLFDALSRDGKRVSAKSIGNTLMSARDRVSDGRHIELVSASGKTSNTYRIVSTATEPEDDAEDEPM